MQMSNIAAEETPETSVDVLHQIVNAIVDQQHTATALVPPSVKLDDSSLKQCPRVFQYGCAENSSTENWHSSKENFVNSLVGLGALNTKPGSSIPLDLAILPAETTLEECLNNLLAWDQLAVVNSLLLIRFDKPFESTEKSTTPVVLAEFVIAKLPFYRIRIINYFSGCTIIICKQQPGKRLDQGSFVQLLKEFSQNRDSGNSALPDGSSLLMAELKNLYTELKNHNYISCVRTELDSIKDNCARNNTSYQTLKPAEQVAVNLPLPSIPATNTPPKTLTFPTQEAYLAELRDVLMYGNFMLCLDRKHLTLAGVRYAGTKFSQMPDVEKGRFGSGYQTFKTNLEINFDEPTILLGPMHHFGHFFVECLDRFWVMEQFPELKQCTVITDRLIQSPYKEILSKLGYQFELSKTIYTGPATWARFSKLYVPSLSTLKPIFPKHIVDFLHDKIAPAPVETSPRGIFLSRSKLSTRQLSNELELIEKLKPHGIEPVYLEDYTFEQQISLMSSVDIVLGVIGSAFFNIIWAKAGTRVGLILNGDDIATRDDSRGHPDAIMYHSIGNARNLDIRNILAKPSNDEKQSSYGVNYNIDLEIGPTLLEEIVDWVAQ